MDRDHYTQIPCVRLQREMYTVVTLTQMRPCNGCTSVDILDPVGRFNAFLFIVKWTVHRMGIAGLYDAARLLNYKCAF